METLQILQIYLDKLKFNFKNICIHSVVSVKINLIKYFFLIQLIMLFLVKHQTKIGLNVKTYLNSNKSGQSKELKKNPALKN